MRGIAVRAKHRVAGKRRAGARSSRCASSSPSVAEIAARLSLPLGVARVLIGDLVTAGLSSGAHHLERALDHRRTA